MSRSRGSDEIGASTFVDELNDIRQIAEMRIMQLDQKRQLAEVVDQIDQSDVQESHIQAQAAVAAYVAKLRPYLAGHDVYQRQDLLETVDNVDESVVMADIIASQGRTVEQTVESGDMFDPSKTETIRVPDLIHPKALRNAVHLLMEQQRALGFLPREREQSVKSDPF